MGLFLSDELGAYSWGDWVLQWPIVCGKVIIFWWVASWLELWKDSSGWMAHCLSVYMYTVHDSVALQTSVHTLGQPTCTWSGRHSKLQKGLMFQEHLHVFERQKLHSWGVVVRPACKRLKTGRHPVLDKHGHLMFPFLCTANKHHFSLTKSFWFCKFRKLLSIFEKITSP